MKGNISPLVVTQSSIIWASTTRPANERIPLRLAKWILGLPGYQLGVFWFPLHLSDGDDGGGDEESRRQENEEGKPDHLVKLAEVYITAK